jgi:hypothetical protein
MSEAPYPLLLAERPVEGPLEREARPITVEVLGVGNRAWITVWSLYGANVVPSISLEPTRWPSLKAEPKGGGWIGTTKTTEIWTRTVVEKPQRTVLYWCTIHDRGYSEE